MPSPATHETHAPFVIEWRNSFSIHIAEIDHEHRHLFTLVKQLDLATVDRTLDELLEYVVIHFTHEQALMENSAYPAFEQHLKLHEQFAAQVAEFLGRDSEWTAARVQEIRRFLNKWLIAHIMTHDLRFGRWYADHLQHAPHVEAKPKDEHRSFLARLFFRR